MRPPRLACLLTTTTTMAAEQDDDLLDNWEDIEENPAVLERRLEKLSVKKPQASESPTILSSQVVSLEDGPRTPFTSQEPKIMILRRPQERTADSAANGIINTRQKQPVKSLEQRQQEYAQARLRILGDAGSAEENKPKPIQQKSLEQREADYAAARLRIMGSTSKSVEEHMLSGTTTSPTTTTTTTSSPSVGSSTPGPQSHSVGVVRCPKGPDGTSGFGRGGGQHR